MAPHTRFLTVPALDQLRNDLKTELFDAIYFLNTDRIARDVTYQNIIIAEILKHRKQIIINGKDYVHNPENKFTLTVLGAVAELERAKIIERATRGKQQRLAQWFLLGCGNNIYGYDYIRRTPHSPPQYAINQQEAAVVQYVFSEYAKGQVGTNPITRVLEDRGVPTKTGKKLWRKPLIKCMLRNETYTGIRYFNTMRLIRDQANPFHVTSRSRKWLVPRDRAEWIGIKIPAIIPHSLFDQVQKRLEWNRTRYRNPRQVQLLSSLVRCGSCGGSFYAYRNWYKDKRGPEPRILHKVAYKCNWRLRQHMHSKNSAVERCHNKEIKAEALEARVFAMIREVMLDPAKLRECTDFFKDDAQAAGRRLQGRLKAIELRLRTLDDQKRRILDIYASGDLSREAYVAKSLRYDTEMHELTGKQKDLAQRMPLLHNTEAVEVAMTEYCGMVKARFERCDARRRDEDQLLHRKPH